MLDFGFFLLKSESKTFIKQEQLYIIMMNKKLISVKIYPSNIDVWYYDEEYEEDVCDTLFIDGFKVGGITAREVVNEYFGDYDDESKGIIESTLRTAGFKK